jgi:hypothetical protein
MKLIFELAIEDVNVTAELEKQRLAVKELTKEFKNFKGSAEDTQALALRLGEAKAQVSELTAQQKALNKEFQAAQFPKDSLVGLRLEYSKLTDQISKLSKAEREGEQGKTLIKNAAAIKQEINGVQESVGNFTGNVGNYKGAILSAAEALSAIGGPIGAQIGLFQQVSAATDLAKAGFAGFSASLSQGVDRLKAGAQGLFDYKKKTEEVVKANEEVAESVGEVNDAVEEVATTGEEAGKGLTSASKGAGILSRAGGALKTVLSSLGIGLLITLVTSLIGAFQKFAPIVDFVEQAVAGLSAAFDVLVSRGALVFSGIGKIFTGNFKSGFDDLAGSVTGVGGAMVDAAFAAADLKRQFQELEDAQKDFALTTAQTDAAIAKLSVSLKDKTKSDSERLRIASQITGLETENLKKKKSLIDQEIDIEKNRLLLSGQVTKEQADQIAAGNFELARELEDNFRLQQDQADRLRELLIQRTQTEGESATLLERVQNRRNAILEAAEQRRAAAAQKAQQEAEKRQKELEAQLTRISEVSRNIRRLDAETIDNEFAREEIELQNERFAALEKVEAQRLALEKKIQGQRGLRTKEDEQEAALISEETASIVAVYDQRFAKISEARQAAFDEQENELRALSLEVQRLATQNAEAIAQIEVDTLNAGFAQQKQTLEQQRAERLKILRDQFAAGDISEKEFRSRSIQESEDYNTKILSIERQRAEQIGILVAELSQAKIEGARAGLDAELNAIQSALDADIAALRERAKVQGIDTAEQIAEREKKAIQERAAAQAAFSDAERQAIEENKNAELAALNAVNEADKQVQEDKLKRLEDEKAKRKELQDAALSVTGTIAGAVLQIEKNRIATQQQEASAALDKEFELRREKAKGNQAELEKIDKEYERRKLTLEKAAAAERKKIAIKEAIIQGALSVVKALPNLILAGLAAIATAAQIAVINSQTFAKGGFTGPGMSRRDATGRRIAGVVHENEYVAPTSQIQRNPWLFDWLEKERRQYLRPFAGGGFTSDVIPQIAIPGQGRQNSGAIIVQTQATFSKEQIDQIANELADRTAEATQSAIGNGLNDANRRLERENALTQNREV